MSVRGARFAALLLTAALAAIAFAQPAGPPVAPTPPAAPLSSTAEAIYAAARPRLLQIRTVVDAAGRQSTIGSGFLVGPDGLALTNYHVVSQYALEPQTYRLEYLAPDGSRGALTLLGFDVAHDLAVVALDRKDLPWFEFDPRALDAGLPKGDRLFALGNPLDLGFAIVEGTYNGLVEKSYNEQIHFTGALNPGMSGGPTVTVGGRVAGVNVAKQVGNDLVSFLVPAKYAAALVERAGKSGPLAPAEARAEITRQLTTWQSAFYAAVADREFKPTTFGPYRAPESDAPWFNCWSHTNADATPKPRALVATTSCRTRTAIFVAGDLQTGSVDFTHSYLRSVDLNAFQFAQSVTNQGSGAWLTGASRKRLTQPQCREDFVASSAPAPGPVLRVVWCARAYRDFAGLYDVSLVTVTQDRNREALLSRLNMRGVTYDNALALGRRFVAAVEWAR